MSDKKSLSFRNELSRRFCSDRDSTRRFSNFGDRYVLERVPEVTDDGVVELRVTGRKDLYAEIQSFKDSCNLELILKRFAAGDQRAAERLQARQGLYGDFAVMPKSLAEAMNLCIQAEDAFNHLPADEKQKFDNNYRTWLLAVNEGKISSNESNVMSTNDSPSTTSSVDTSEPTT